MRWRTVVVAALVGLAGCEKDHSAPAPASTGSVAVSKPSAAAPQPSASSTPPKPAARGQKKRRRWYQQPLTQWRMVRGQARGQLGARPVALLLATKLDPIGHRHRVAYSRIAQVVAPMVAARVALRSHPLKTLATTTHDAKSLAFLRQSVRVLGDGAVEGAVMQLSLRGFGVDDDRVNLADVRDGTPVHDWERHLMAKELSADAPLSELRDYATVLMLDYLMDNGMRGEVAHRPGHGLVAFDASHAFAKPQGDNIVGDPMKRLSRYRFFPAEFVHRLRRQDRGRFARWVGGDPVQRLATERQLDGIVKRRADLLRMVDRHIKLRGKKAALALR